MFRWMLFFVVLLVGIVLVMALFLGIPVPGLTPYGQYTQYAPMQP